MIESLSRERRSQVAALATVLRSHRWTIGIIAAYVAAGQVVAAAVGVRHEVAYGMYSLAIVRLSAWMFVAAVVGRAVWVIVAVRPRGLVRHLAEDLRARWGRLDRLAGGGLVLLLLPPFMSVYTSMKRLIPRIEPFSWDVAFYEWDRVLHGGIDPWRLIHPVVGYPLVTYAISFVYQSWVFVMYGVLLWQTFDARRPRLRSQFLITFLLLWVLLGTVLATVFSSGGPCYFERLTGLADPYAPLFAYLRAVAMERTLPALAVQERLWDVYTGGTMALGAGISAMPSLHVASSVLFALVGWQADRRLGALLWAFAAGIMIGSVHLGWHYAVDGYVSIVLTVLLWRLVGRLVARDASLGP